MRKGFTLAEMLVSITIIVVLAGIATTNWLKVSASYEKQKIATEIAQAITITRQMAITYHKQAKIHFDFTNQKYYYFVDINGNGTNDPGEKLKVVNIDSPPYKIYSGGTGNELTFKPNGATLGTPYELKTQYLSEPRKKIVVSIGGSITIEDE